MGIPRFYRYMSERYPLINQPVSDVSLLPEFDAFYLDMNGIIHNCTHSDDDDERNTFGLREQLQAIFAVMDKLISEIIKPKQLVFIAIDGVAPRAKLNQQRSRRFRAGLDRQKELEEQRKERFRQITLEDEKNGVTVGQEPTAERFDSNCITPGTEFLFALSSHLVYYIRSKMKNDPLWARLEVFFSGSEVPGEGEHKIAEFIRQRKMQPGYKPNVRHCMYGSDADLMLLGLMTHEPHFTLVRETVVWGRQNGASSRVTVKKIEQEQWQLVHLSLFREYLMMEMQVTSDLDGERVLDDFIFLTFLLGNDFIPHSPTLEISEDALPLLCRVYRELLETHHGEYLTENGKLNNIPLLQELCRVIGDMEEDILTNRAIEEARRHNHRGGGQMQHRPKPVQQEAPLPKPRHQNSKPIANKDAFILNTRLRRDDSEDDDDDEVDEATMAKRRAQYSLDSDDDSAESPPPLEDDSADESSPSEEDLEKQLLEALDGPEQAQEALAEEEELHELLVLSGSESFQETKWSYYGRKFNVHENDPDASQKLFEIKKNYLEALVWCLSYYFQGPPSWGWYYPYHYSPMISDLTDIEPLLESIEFDDDFVDKPLLPFQQLMANLPSSSAHLVPKPYRFLMVSPLSPIKSFYPEKFEIDMEGKRNAWEGVNLLPFIDVNLLLEAIEEHCPDSRLTTAEKQRNRFGKVLRFVADVNAVETVRSTYPGFLPDIPCCASRVTVLDWVNPEKLPFESRLVPGVQVPLAGFPSLNTIQLKSVRAASVRLNCFGMSSRKQTLVLELPAAPAVDQHKANSLLGRTVLVNWPHLHEALVIALSSLSGMYRYDRVSGTISYQEHLPEEKTMWASYAQTEVFKLLSGRGVPGSGGIDLGSAGISACLHVLPLQGMIADPMTGAVQKRFGNNEAVVPLQMSVIERCLLDERYCETGPVALATRFPVGRKALIISGKWLGCTSEVQQVHEKENKVTVQVHTIDKEPPFGYAIARQITERYYSGTIVCQRLGLSPTALGVLTGSLKLAVVKEDIGLNLKVRKELLLPGYCRLVGKKYNKPTAQEEQEKANVWRRGDIIKILGSDVIRSNGEKDPMTSEMMMWEYSEQAMQLVQMYQAAYPEIVRNLERLPFAKSYYPADLFGLDSKDKEGIEKKVEEVKAWLEGLQLGKAMHARHIPTSAEFLCSNAVRAIEAAGTIRAKEREKMNEAHAKRPVLKLDASMLFRPNPLINQDLTGSQVSMTASRNKGAPVLGDRVINIDARGVPFGHRGTVVATYVSSRCVEVLFDEPFPGGHALYGTSSLDRGRVVPWNSLLAVSVPSEGRPSMQPGYNVQTRTYQQNRQHQPVPVSAHSRTTEPGNRRQEQPLRIGHKVIQKKPQLVAQSHDQPQQAHQSPANVNEEEEEVDSSVFPATPSLPDPAKMAMLLSKWTKGGSVPFEPAQHSANGDSSTKEPDGKTSTRSPKRGQHQQAKEQNNAQVEPVAPPSQTQDGMIPAVAALFAAVETSAEVSPNSDNAAADLMALFPHMNDQRAAAPPPPPLPPAQMMFYPNVPMTAPPPAMYHQAPPPPSFPPQPPIAIPLDQNEFPSLGIASASKEQKKKNAPSKKPLTPAALLQQQKQQQQSQGKSNSKSRQQQQPSNAKKWKPKDQPDQATPPTSQPSSSTKPLLLPTQVLGLKKKK